MTSMQPLGDAMVMVVYILSSNNDVMIDGFVVNSMLKSDYVSAENLASHVLVRWHRAIEAERVLLS